MSGYFLSVVLAGAALAQGAEPQADEAPVTVEAAPAETAPAPSTDPAQLPDIDLPAQTVQGDPAPPQSLEAPQGDEAPSATDGTAGSGAEDQKAEGDAPISEELIRPTEKKDRSGQKVGAFWFITTGK